MSVYGCLCVKAELETENLKNSAIKIDFCRNKSTTNYNDVFS